MPLLPTLGRTVGTGVKAVRLVVRGSVRGSAWATRRVGSARARGAANEVGMIRLFDLHAVSCAGDALIAIGLAGTIFSVPLGEARSQVGLYLLITMVPFALLAPVVGPLLDHFRHGRRYALATTMLGRAFLAYVMADNLLGWGLYPAAFGVLALSRAYGVARSAAVPRLLPAGVGLSQVGARASVYGTFAGILVAPIGLLAFKFGSQWPLRVAAVIFLIGVVVALRLPPRADADPPEEMPRPWRAVFRTAGSGRPLAERLVVATLIGSSSLRLLYGFLLLFLTFAIMGGSLDTSVFGLEMSRGAAVGVVGAALALGTFLSTAAGTGLQIRRPLALQSSGLVITAGVAVLTAIFYNLAMVALLALLTAVFSGIAKLAVDASIQERVGEQQRATAFAHSETVLMLSWVVGGGLGIIPFAGRLGMALAALLAVLAAARGVWAAARLRNERLAGRPDTVADPDPAPVGASATRGKRTASGGARAGRPGTAADAARGRPAGDPTGVRGNDTDPASPHSSGDPDQRDDAAFGLPADPWPEAPTDLDHPRATPPPQRRSGPSAAPGRGAPGRSAPLGSPASRPAGAGGSAGAGSDGSTGANGSAGASAGGSAGGGGSARAGGSAGAGGRDRLDPTLVERPARKWWRRNKPAGDRSKERPAAEPETARIRPAGDDAASTSHGRPADDDPIFGSWIDDDAPATAPIRREGPGADVPVTPPVSAAPPGYHVYRPSSAGAGSRNGDSTDDGEDL